MSIPHVPYYYIKLLRQKLYYVLSTHMLNCFVDFIHRIVVRENCYVKSSKANILFMGI